ncbi:MAG: ankyrin repeat domain-containing protein, partial [Gammaproteobacteria bacterium]|nr:ankyrin repeat domain-containing protein [Gammaproteobacteria bacterium]
KYSKFRAARLLLDAGCDPDYQDATGMTALHYMLKKNSDKKHIGLFVNYGARGDIPNAENNTAAALMLRKRDPDYHRIVEQFGPTQS